MMEKCVSYNKVAVGKEVAKRFPGMLANASNYKKTWDEVYKNGTLTDMFELCDKQKFLKEVRQDSIRS